MFNWKDSPKEDRELVFSAATIYDKINAFNSLTRVIQRAMDSKEARAVVAAHQLGIADAAKRLKVSKATVRAYVRAFELAAYRKIKADPPRRSPRTMYMKKKTARRMAAGAPLCGDVILGLIAAHHLVERGVDQNYALFSLQPGEMDRRERAMQKWLRQRQREAAKARRKFFPTQRHKRRAS